LRHEDDCRDSSMMRRGCWQSWFRIWDYMVKMWTTLAVFFWEYRQKECRGEEIRNTCSSLALLEGWFMAGARQKSCGILCRPKRNQSVVKQVHKHSHISHTILEGVCMPVLYHVCDVPMWISLMYLIVCTSMYQWVEDSLYFEIHGMWW